MCWLSLLRASLHFCPSICDSQSSATSLIIHVYMPLELQSFGGRSNLAAKLHGVVLLRWTAVPNSMCWQIASSYRQRQNQRYGHADMMLLHWADCTGFHFQKSK